MSSLNRLHCEDGPPTLIGLYELVSAATLAPSSHNTQPWVFVPGECGVCLRADRSRRLPVSDPDDRELMISCGAAVLTLQTAAAAHGYGTRVDHDHPDHVACLTWVPEADTSLAKLGDAVVERHVWRGPFDPDRLADGTVEALADACATEGAHLAVVQDTTARDEVARLVAEADRRQFADPAWRRELATWMHPHGSPDGLAQSRYVGRFSPPVIRHLDVGRVVSRRDRRRVLDAPLLVVLTTPADTDPDRMAAGRAFQHLSLLATRHHLAVGMFSQACQVPDLRARLGAVVGDGVPQLLLAVGRPHGAPATSGRRLAGDMMRPWVEPAGPGIHPHPGVTHVPPRLLGGIGGDYGPVDDPRSTEHAVRGPQG